MDVVDTDVLIDVQRQHPPALLWFSGLTALPVIPGFVVMEFGQDAKDAKEVRQALKLVAPFRIIWPSEADCQRALANFSAYHLSPRLGLLDSLIAARATALSGTLLSFNAKHYRAVPGVKVIEPYAR